MQEEHTNIQASDGQLPYSHVLDKGTCSAWPLSDPSPVQRELCNITMLKEARPALGPS